MSNKSNYSEYALTTNDLDDETPTMCPACKGRGVNRWEDDECQICYGEGELL